MNQALIQEIDRRLWAANTPAGTYSTPESAGQHIGNLEIQGHTLAMAVLHGLPAEELQRIALNWVRLRGVQVPA